MKKYGRDKRPYIKPVTRIELNETNTRLRWIAVVVLLSIAVVAVLVGLMSALNTEPGWQEVEVSASSLNCSQDFAFMYDFGEEGISASAEYKLITDLYTRLTEFGFQIFSAETEVEGLSNLYYLNAHVNEPVTVSHELYKALELIAAYDSRYPFLAPVYAEYNAIFLSENSAEAAHYDPAQNPELVPYIQQTTAFAADPDMISVTLLGEDQVQLNVSQEYLAYAEEWGIGTFLDFGWMKNAFILDYMADTLSSSGYTNGYLSSYDGFTRNLDARGETYTFNLFDRAENTVSMPACLNYTKPISIVYLRNYPLSESDRWHYFAFDNGSIASVLLDIADGMSKSATDNLVSYSGDMGCAEILLQTAPIFIADSLDQAALANLAGSGIHSVWGEGSVLRYTDAHADLTLLPESGGEDYTLKMAE